MPPLDIGTNGIIKQLKNLNQNKATGPDELPARGSALCSPVPMFPGTDVPRTYVPRYLCSPVPMFPGTDVPRFFTLIVD